MRRRLLLLRYRLGEWWACRTGRCSYVTHYLAHGPAELTHAGYHAAERHCLRVQKQAERQFDERGNLTPGMERLCQYWERKVRA